MTEKKTEKKAASKKPLTKSEIQANLAAATGLTKKQVSSVLDALAAEINKSVGPKAAGAFVLPGLLKIEKKKVPAKPARKNVPDPFHPGTFKDYPAKPASCKIKIRPLKGLKDAAAK
ncbi:MAG: HU family DNA-binding protein [Planctomycetia bacterium]|nr:HU family DNA-binding protein [Planctomycetia bacterium]